jgi:putative membrane protein
MKDKIVIFFPLILLIFHIIGVGVFLYPERPEGLSGANMILCTLLVFLAAGDWKKELGLLVFIFFGGFLVEFIGVNTGILFGTYAYGSELGWEIGGVPYVLGLNWYCVVASSAHIIQKGFYGLSLFTKALLTGILCVVLDFLIEPVAMAYDFWDWENHVVPILNYVCWGIFSSIFAAVYLYFINKENKTAWSLYFIWAAFFLILNIFH